MDDLEEMIGRVVERKLADFTVPKGPDDSGRQWHSVKEEAARIGVSIKTIHRWKDRGEIPFSRKKKARLFGSIRLRLISHSKVKVYGTKEVIMATKSNSKQERKRWRESPSIRVRIPEERFNLLVHRAERDGVSRSKFILRLIEDNVKA